MPPSSSLKSMLSFTEEVKQLQENGAKVITLGKRILRTETVALNLISILMYELEI